MRRFEVREEGQTPLPPVDADGDVVIGSGPSATLRLPGAVAEPVHVRIDSDGWHALAETVIDGAHRPAGDVGPLDSTVELGIGRFRVRISSSPTGAVPVTPQRTESLARELVRAMLGDGGAPELEVERGPRTGTRRKLAPPESALIIGRGDEATWVLVDEDLSRAHAEIRRGWDGVRIVDLGSKNGTRVDGVDAPATGTGLPLRDGALVELGPVILRFHDPAEAHMHGGDLLPKVPLALPPPRRASSTLLVALVVAVVAIAGMIWLATT